jgi:hypothetical protein
MSKLYEATRSCDIYLAVVCSSHSTIAFGGGMPRHDGLKQSSLGYWLALNFGFSFVLPSLDPLMASQVRTILSILCLPFYNCLVVPDSPRIQGHRTRLWSNTSRCQPLPTSAISLTASTIPHSETSFSYDFLDCLSFRAQLLRGTRGLALASQP